MTHFLAMENCREPRQHRFHQHPCVPGATRTDFHVGRIAALGMESRISQDNHPAVKLGNQGVKMRVVDVGGGAVQAQIKPHWFTMKQSLPPTIHR
jgi:hypothetical protein